MAQALIASSVAPKAATSAWRPRPGVYAIPMLAVLAGLYLVPLINLLVASLSDPTPGLANYYTVASPAYLKTFLNTFRLSVIVTFITAILAYPLAYALTIARPMIKSLIMVAVLVPFWTSVLVRSFAWTIILGQNGVINSVLIEMNLIAQPLQLVFNTTGVVIAMVHVMLPLMVLPLYSVLVRIDKSLVAAARSLGASPIQSFTTVFFPLSLPGVWSGATLVFLLSIGYYITPALLGGQEEITVPSLIDINVNELLNLGVGSALSVTLLLIVCAAYLVIRAISGAGRELGATR